MRKREERIKTLRKRNSKGISVCNREMEVVTQNLEVDMEFGNKKQSKNCLPLHSSCYSLDQAQHSNFLFPSSSTSCR